jgi:hypothetical protein
VPHQRSSKGHLRPARGWRLGTPPRSETSASPSEMGIGTAFASTIFAAIRPAVRGSLRSGIRTTNSSPPILATVSSLRTMRISRWAVTFSTSSPAGWPVVDCLEVLQVHHQHCQPIAMPLRALQGHPPACAAITASAILAGNCAGASSTSSNIPPISRGRRPWRASASSRPRSVIYPRFRPWPPTRNWMRSSAGSHISRACSNPVPFITTPMNGCRPMSSWLRWPCY